MFTVEALEYAIKNLFRGGAGYDYDTDEIEEKLEQIDFKALVQAARNERTTLYAFSVHGSEEDCFSYRGPELFGQPAVYLCEDLKQASIRAGGSEIIASRSIELWLLEDMTIVPVTCVTISTGKGGYLAEYRVIKEVEPWECGMEIDLDELVAGFEDMCLPVYQGTYPIYEL